MAHWVARDPLIRIRRYLTARGLLGERAVAALDAEAEDAAAALRARMNAGTRHDPAELFRHVYAEPTPALRAQEAQLGWERADGGEDAR